MMQQTVFMSAVPYPLNFAINSGFTAGPNIAKSTPATAIQKHPKNMAFDALPPLK